MTDEDSKKEDPGWPSDLPPPEEFAREIMENSSLECSIVNPDPELEDLDLCTTVIGRVGWGIAGEEWPTYDEKPMVGVCQFNLKEAPFVPDCLSDLAFVSVYMARDEYWPMYAVDAPTDPEKDIDKWEVRAYRATEELVPLPDVPPEPDKWTPARASFEVTNDYPGKYDVLYQIAEQRGLPEQWVYQIEEVIYELAERDDDIQWRTKLGGYPAPIQDPIVRPLAIQIGSDYGIGMEWVDSGCVYIWRNDTDSLDDWDLEVAFY